MIGEPNWFLLTLLSPYAGLYYWRSGDRVDECSIKLEANDDETENTIQVQGPEEEIERMWRTLEWQEKGMVKIEGLWHQGLVFLAQKGVYQINVWNAKSYVGYSLNISKDLTKKFAQHIDLLSESVLSSLYFSINMRQQTQLRCQWKVIPEKIAKLRALRKV